jgi:hypothetical protein
MRGRGEVDDLNMSIEKAVENTLLKPDVLGRKHKRSKWCFLAIGLFLQRGKPVFLS